jgi:hypothetical protein
MTQNMHAMYNKNVSRRPKLRQDDVATGSVAGHDAAAAFSFLHQAA